MNLTLPAGGRSAIALALAIITLVGGAIAYVASSHLWAANRLAELEPRYARLLGLGQSATAVEAALAERRAFLARHSYPPGQDVARAGSEALQKARETFSQAGLDVSSTQVLPAKEADGFDRIPLVLRLEGDLAAVQAALVVMPGLTPSLFVESFSMQAANPRPDLPQRLTLQVNLFALRARK